MCPRQRPIISRATPRHANDEELLHHAPNPELHSPASRPNSPRHSRFSMSLVRLSLWFSKLKKSGLSGAAPGSSDGSWYAYTHKFVSLQPQASTKLMEPQRSDRGSG